MVYFRLSWIQKPAQIRNVCKANKSQITECMWNCRHDFLSWNVPAGFTHAQEILRTLRLAFLYLSPTQGIFQFAFERLSKLTASLQFSRLTRELWLNPDVAGIWNIQASHFKSQDVLFCPWPHLTLQGLKN